MPAKQEEKQIPWWGWILGGSVIAGIGYAIFRKKVDLSSAYEAGKEIIMNTFASKDDFIHRLWDALTRNTSLSTIAKTILIAQAIHESEWGVATGSRKGYNYWNLTAGPYWWGPVLQGRDLEYKSPTDANPTTITQSFRAYPNDDASMKDMIAFIGPNTRYSKAWGILTDESRGVADRTSDYLTALHDAGFFTQPPDLYIAAVKNYIPQVVSALG